MCILKNQLKKQRSFSCILKDIEKALKNVPEQDTPKLLDLPENVNRSWQKKQSTETISQLRREYTGCSSDYT